ncbi:MAG: ABC transporter permease [Firmicutes bacterium]|nr:ABC transporter permease [Bacillota bacterium]
MLNLIVRRLLLAIPVMFGVLVAVFVGLHVLPGNVAQAIGGPHATAAQIALITRQLGLDKPIYVQFWVYLSQVVRGQLGTSLRTHDPVTVDLMQAFPYTLQLTLAAFVLASLVGVAAGMVAAVYRNSWLDSALMSLVLVGISMPVFWTGILLMLLFAVDLPWFPLSGVLSPGLTVPGPTGLPVLDGLLTGNWAGFGDALSHLVLPAVTLATYTVAFIARMTRAAMVEVLQQDYLRTARAKGLAGPVVVFKHALRNAALPVVTVMGIQLGTLLSGAVLTETIFAIPGLGRLTITSILFRDYPEVQGIVLLAALLFVLVNLLTDVLYGLLDPRIRYQ